MLKLMTRTTITSTSNYDLTNGRPTRVDIRFGRLSRFHRVRWYVPGNPLLDRWRERSSVRVVIRVVVALSCTRLERWGVVGVRRFGTSARVVAKIVQPSLDSGFVNSGDR